MLTAPSSPIAHWALDPAVVHLNHGSFGGCPRAVFDAAVATRARIEAAPMRFYVLDWQAELDAARAGLARFVGAAPERLVFVPGATAGVATALASIAATIGADDELVTTSHVYPACRNQLVRLCEARGARLVIVELALPFDADAMVEAITRAVTARTRLALLDHVTSPTALVLPLERLIPLLAARGIPVIVDGAHAPGQLALDVDRLGATYYVGNCHKWLCAPKASGFVVVGEHATLRPLVTSHGATPSYGPANRLHAEHDWCGTSEVSAQLAVPTAIAEVAAAGGGWPAVIARNHALAIELRARLGGARLASDDALGAMAAMRIELPAGVAPKQLERQLLIDGWEVPIVDLPGSPLVRVSAHLYNHAAQADDLAAKLRGMGVRIV